jgi:N utilization substance protein A
LLEKLQNAGVNTIEELADMHPEQLEAIPGIGPKTMEKIFYTINNYFSGLEMAEGGAPAEVEAAPLDQSEAGVSEEGQSETVSPDQSGEDAAISDLPEQASERTAEAEASIISSGVEEADNPTGEENIKPDDTPPGDDDPATSGKA